MTGKGVIPALLGLPLLLLLAAPVLVLAWRSGLGGVWAELTEPRTRAALWLSVWTSGTALAVSVAFGTPLAVWMARSRSRWARAAETLVDLPTVLPPSVAGLALLLTLGRSGPVGRWLESAGLAVAFTPAAVVLAQVFVASPYFVRSARAGFAGVGRDLVEAARIDGAAGWHLFRRVSAPMAARSLAAGAAMCWSRAVGEFGATVLFAGNMPGRTQTMPLAIGLGLEEGLDRALVLSAVLLLAAVVVLGGVRLLAGRGAG